MGPLGLGLGVTGVRRGAVARVFDFTGGALPPGATLTRGSAAMRWTAGGTLAAVAADAARFDHDPATGVLRGLLVEPAASNLAVQSAALETAAWTPYRATATADAGVAPDGTAGADRLVEDPTPGPQTCFQLVSTASGTVTLSAFAKPSGRNHATLVVNPGGAVDAYAFATFDLASAAVTISGANGATMVATANEAAGGGWRRIAVTATMQVGDPYLYVGPALPTTPAGGYGVPRYTGSAGTGVLIWGVQCERGGGASSPIASGAAAAGRAADALVLDWGLRGVPDGPATVRYTFDDGSSQDVAAMIAGGSAAVPTNLARRWLRRAEIS